MADVNRGDRPLSPHLTVYRPQITSMMSIFHRITGVAMALGAALVVWWLLAASIGADYFATADWVLTSWLGLLVMFGMSWALFYHLCNGVRHLVWDAGYGFELEHVSFSGIVVIVASGMLAIFLWITAL